MTCTHGILTYDTYASFVYNICSTVAVSGRSGTIAHVALAMGRFTKALSLKFNRIRGPKKPPVRGDMF